MVNFSLSSKFQSTDDEKELLLNQLLDKKVLCISLLCTIFNKHSF